MTCECLKIRYTLKWPLTGENDRKKHWDFGMSNFHTNPNMRLLNNAEYIYINIIYLYIYTYIPFYPCSWMIFPLSLQYSDTMTVVQPSFRDLQSQSNPGAQEHHACERSPWPNTQRDDESSPWIMHGKDCHGFPSSGINQLHQH
jgi:hypothetical protein